MSLEQVRSLVKDGKFVEEQLFKTLHQNHPQYGNIFKVIKAFCVAFEEISNSVLVVEAVELTLRQQGLRIIDMAIEQLKEKKKVQTTD